MWAKWVVRGCLGTTTFACLYVMAFGTGWSFLVASILLLLSWFVYVPMLEKLE